MTIECFLWKQNGFRLVMPNVICSNIIGRIVIYAVIWILNTGIGSSTNKLVPFRSNKKMCEDIFRDYKCYCDTHL